MFVTITIQTYNRSAVLAETLESLRPLQCPAGVEYEILVVDNNSTDDTPQVLQKYGVLLAPRLRSVFEPQQGLSHARNRALREAQGEIVSFLDDDVKVDPGWLAAVTSAFQEHAAAVVGGRSYLIYPSRRPSWLPEDCEYLLSKLDYGDQVLVDTDKELYGLNLSVRKELALRVGGFDPSLGRKGSSSLRSGEEVEFLRKIRALDRRVIYAPKAVVGHMVSKERLRMRWFLRRAFAPGVCPDSVHTSQAALHLARCCGSLGKSLLRGERLAMLFGKTLSIIAAFRHLCASLRKPWLSKKRDVAPLAEHATPCAGDDAIL